MPCTVNTQMYNMVNAIPFLMCAIPICYCRQLSLYTYTFYFSSIFRLLPSFLLRALKKTFSSNYWKIELLNCYCRKVWLLQRKCPMQGFSQWPLYAFNKIFQGRYLYLYTVRRAVLNSFPMQLLLYSPQSVIDFHIK